MDFISRHIWKSCEIYKLSAICFVNLLHNYGNYCFASWINWKRTLSCMALDKQMYVFGISLLIFYRFIKCDWSPQFHNVKLNCHFGYHGYISDAIKFSKHPLVNYQFILTTDNCQKMDIQFDMVYCTSLQRAYSHPIKILHHLVNWHLITRV